MTKINEEEFFTVCKAIAKADHTINSEKAGQENRSSKFLNYIQQYPTVREAQIAFCIRHNHSVFVIDEITGTRKLQEGQNGGLPKGTLKKMFSQGIRAEYAVGQEKFRTFTKWQEVVEAGKKQKSEYRIKYEEYMKALSENFITENQSNLDKLGEFVKTFK